MNTDLVTTSEPNLYVSIDAKAVSLMSEQIHLLKEFVQGQLIKGVDYGTIPGCQNPCLLKPGAEKLCSVFNLGSRILNYKENIDWEKSRAMYTFTVEVFSHRTGLGVAQCAGSCNSEERRFKKRDGTPLPFGDTLNPMMKMAQKRAFVGAVVAATKASDFFTVDVEDIPDLIHTNSTIGGTADERQDLGSYVVKLKKFHGKKLSEINPKDLANYLSWWQAKASKGEDIGFAREFIAKAQKFLEKHQQQQGPEQAQLPLPEEEGEYFETEEIDWTEEVPHTISEN